MAAEGEAGEEKGRRRGWVARWTRRGLIGLLGLVFLVLAALFFLLRTGPGQQIVLDQLLPRAQGLVEGRIVVDRLRSRDLRRGATLVGVGIEGPDGEPFLRADSLRAEYSWRSFLSGNVVLSDVTLFSPEIVIEQRPGEETTNAQRIFPTGEGERPDTAPPPRVTLRDLQIVDGRVRVAIPQEGPVAPRTLTDTTEAGEILRVMRFEELDAAASRALLSGPGLEAPEFTLEAFSTVAYIYEDPARLDDLQGILTLPENEVVIEVERLEIGESEAKGTAVADFASDEGLVLRLDLETPGAELTDFRWAEPRLPDGTATGGIGLRIAPAGLRWDFTEASVDLGETRIRADGVWIMAEEAMAFEGLDLELSPLDLDRVRPWVEFEVPLEGTVRGSLSLDGDLGRLATEGHLTLEEPGTGEPATTADFRGTLHASDGVGVTDLVATVDPLDYDLLKSFRPDASISGTGRLEIEATGSLDQGLRFTVEGVHRAEGVPTSMVVADGSVRRSDGTVNVDITADAAPLSMTAVKRYVPRVPVTGEIRGSVRATGPLSDLRVVTDLETPAGELDLVGRVDALRPGEAYSVEGQVSRFRLSSLVPSLPEPTEVTGRIALSGRGLDPATADARATLRAHRSRVGGLHVDTATVELRVGGGRLTVDTLDAVAGGFDVRGSGSLPVDTAGRDGTVRIAFDTDSVGRLRSLFLGDTVIARDTLSVLDRERLALEGVDPDTLPTQADVTLSGAAGGEVVLTGSLESFSAEGTASLQRIGYADNFVRGAEIDFQAGELPSLEGQVHLEVEADSLQLLGRAFVGGELELDYTRPGGRMQLALRRSDEEDYSARAVFELNPEGGRVELEEMALRFDTLTWRLADRATVDWSGEGVTVRNLEILRPGADGLRIAASGTLPTRGQADFELDIQGLHLARLTQLAQREEVGLEGTVGAELTIRGTASEPVITGSVEAVELAYENFALSRLAGEIAYEDREIELDVEAWKGEQQVLTASGTVPADLALTEVEDRFPQEEMDLTVRADSLPATFALSLMEDLREVTGTVDGDFTITGTPDDPSPSGTLRIENAAFLLPAVGVRYRNVEGSLELRPDGTVQVDASARAGGTVDVSGTITLAPLTNPEFDLVLDFERFRAVSRRDVEGAISGSVTLTGSYRLPRIQGSERQGRGLVVDQGTIQLEEFQRAATVVDLSDPRFFDVADTTLARARPIIAASQNPFLQNLRVNVDLAVERNTWLRSPDMNVEIRGDLVVVYDRQSDDIALVGELQAVRGDYTLYNRRFEVTSGVVEFVGTPGINPNLDIVARTRIRRPEAQPLTVNAELSGTLVDPRVSLSSPDQAVARDDLVSYLLFGRPTYALTSGQAASVESAGSTLFGQGVSAAFGTFTSALGSTVAREVGLDYVAISQAGSGRGGSGGAGPGLQRTTLEVGSYLKEDLFLVAILQPFATTSGSDFLGGKVEGLRLEWSANETATIELFLESRVLRGRSSGFQELAIRSDLILGISALWEWGY